MHHRMVQVEVHHRVGFGEVGVKILSCTSEYYYMPPCASMIHGQLLIIKQFSFGAHE